MTGVYLLQVLPLEPRRVIKYLADAEFCLLTLILAALHHTCEAYVYVFMRLVQLLTPPAAPIADAPLPLHALGWALLPAHCRGWRCRQLDDDGSNIGQDIVSRPEPGSVAVARHGRATLAEIRPALT